MRLPSLSIIALALDLRVLAAPWACLPVVDLGYQKHRALRYDESTGLFKFQNIPYAREPTGDLRFRAPQPPLTNRNAIETGSKFRICPQGRPDWQAKANPLIGRYSNPNVTFNLENWENDLLHGTVPPGDINTNADEDCLLLDVHVPKNVLQRAQHGSADVPVLVFIHGGGYVLGSKDASGPTVFDPSGIISQVKKSSGKELIYVALNYRLGALGFLVGEEVQKHGDLNAGLLDQRMALEWIQKYVHLFGGSKDHVTVMGESAGGGSILLHMIAGRGKGSTPFRQAIPQSPAIAPVTEAPGKVFDQFLGFLNVTSLSEARQADTKAIIAANAAHVNSAPPTTYIYGPVVDGKFLPEPSLKTIKKGDFDQSVKVMTGHNVFEGGFFLDPTVQTNDQFRDWLGRSLPGLGSERTRYLVETLYPDNFDGSLGYVDQDTRQMKLWSEAVIDCHYNLISEATKDHSYAYEFGVSPGFHVQDLSYTFGNASKPAPFPEAQESLQLAIGSFAQGGVPLLKSSESFPLFGNEKMIVNITSEGREPSVRTLVNQTRCDWWASAL